MTNPLDARAHEAPFRGHRLVRHGLFSDSGRDLACFSLLKESSRTKKGKVLDLCRVKDEANISANTNMSKTKTTHDLTLKAKLFRGLGDRSRLSILECLRERSRNVSEIIDETGLTQSNASMHLECLYCCGLVDRERDGRFVYYSLRSKAIQRLLDAAVSALDEAAEQIQACGRYRA